MSAIDAKMILVVDEDIPRREELVEFVRRLGFIAIPAADRESAGVIARKLHVDLVILRIGDDLAALAAISDFKRRRPDTAVLALAQRQSVAEPLLRSAGIDVAWPGPGTLIDLEEPIRRLVRTVDRGR